MADVPHPVTTPSSGQPLRAIILVGGFGTRLRPLTHTVPKPTVPVCNVPIVVHQLEWLHRVGVREVVFATMYKADQIYSALAAAAVTQKLKIRYSFEPVPLGTGGPLALARKLLFGGRAAHYAGPGDGLITVTPDTPAEAAAPGTAAAPTTLQLELADTPDDPPTDYDGPVFLLNSDIVFATSLAPMLAFHRAHGREATMAVTPVEDPSRFGVVLYDEVSGAVRSFHSKPKHFVSRMINAGITIIEARAFRRIPLRQISIEREIYPELARIGELFCWSLPGIWCDVGTLPSYLTGTQLLLSSYCKLGRTQLAQREDCRGNVLIDPSATIGAGCLIGPDVVIGPGCRVGSGVRLSNTVLLGNAHVGAHTLIDSSIIGWNCVIEAWCRIENVSALGEGVRVASTCYLNGAKAWCGIEITKNHPEPTVLM